MVIDEASVSVNLSSCGIDRRDNYVMVLMHRDSLGDDFRHWLIDSYSNDEDHEMDFSLVLIIGRKNGLLDFENCYLHISTIGAITTDDFAFFIKNVLKGRIELLDNQVTLSTDEKIEILNRLIPYIDMREVI